MLINDNINFTINNRTKKYYSEKYNRILNVGDIINIPINDLSPSSHIKIDVKCDICGEIHNVFYYNYVIQMNRHNIYCCSQKCAMFKNNLTCLKKYGNNYGHDINMNKKTIQDKLDLIQDKCNKYNYNVLSYDGRILELICNKDGNIWKTNYLNFIKNNQICNKCSEIEKIDLFTNKINEKCIENNYVFHGFLDDYKNAISKFTLSCSKGHVWQPTYKHYILCDSGCPECGINKRVISSKITKINNGNQISDDKLSDYEIYRRIIDNTTSRNKKQLFKDWDGFDYYDGEYIRENLSLKFHESNYPSIDHKISIFYGYKNGISPEIIGDISNLCITKRYINSTKNSKTEDEYKKPLIS